MVACAVLYLDFGKGLQHLTERITIDILLR